MKKRNLIQLLALVLILSLVPMQVFAADLDEILTRGKIQIGMYNQDPGRMFIDPLTNELIGLEPDIAVKFAEYLGVECEIVQAEWDALIPGLLADKFDIIIANMARLPSRATSVDFTLAFENYDGTCIAVRADEENIKGWADFKDGVRVATGRGNSAEAYTVKNYPDVEIVPFASPQLGIQALVAGQVDAVVENYTAMIKFQEAFDQIKLIETEQLVNCTSTGFGIKPGNFRLWLWANLFLIRFKENGDYKMTYQKWYPDITPSTNAFDVH